MDGPRLSRPPPGGLAAVADEGAVAEPFGIAPAVVLSFGDDGAVRVPFIGLGVGAGTESISMASASPSSESSVKAWYLGREASDSSCVFEVLFCGTEAFRAAFGRFVASDDLPCNVSFVSL